MYGLKIKKQGQGKINSFRIALGYSTARRNISRQEATQMNNDFDMKVHFFFIHSVNKLGEAE